MRFTKMHGLGNDYIFIDGTTHDLEGVDLAELAVKMSDRHFGVGGDGIILILPSRVADFRMRIFNSDGSEAEMCGNGVRCFARYVYDRGLTTKTEITVETLAGEIRPRLLLEGGEVRAVRVNMGLPRFDPAKIPVVGDFASEGTGPVRVKIPLDDGTADGYALSMGNPHCVIFSQEAGVDMARSRGPLVEALSMFPHRVNVEFARVEGPSELAVYVWERGAGFTLACGTGACAAVVAALSRGLVRGPVVRARLPGGELAIEWDGSGPVYLTGPAEFAFEGTYLGSIPRRKERSGG